MNTMPEEMPDTFMPDKIQPNYSLKILFGPMYGCELHLTADDYFLLINPALSLQDKTIPLESSHHHAAHYSINTLYIPSDSASPNITLYLSGTSDSDESRRFHIEVSDASGSYDSMIAENQVVTIGPIRFALKRSDEIWSDEIKNFNQPTASNIVLNERKSAVLLKKRKIRTIISAIFLMATLLASASLIWFSKFESQQRVLTLSESLAGAPSPLYIVKARDKQDIYVLAHNFQEMEWAKEALFKLKTKPDVIPVWLKEQRLTVVARLQHSGHPVIQIDYSKPQNPLLSVYRQLSKLEEASLKNAVLQYIPFALDVGVKTRTKKQLLQDARQGLERLHIPYRQTTTATGYGLIVRDALSDSTLSSLKHLINEFNHKWGNSIISFSINLDENWLKDKSYLDSSNGYLFMNPRHWYFPLNHGNF
ncbi:PrgH/EprH family type III secretion apparatus protein [Erwinia piriflorinigrans]|uniref:Type III secretion system protein PrgH/EprH n=1 Tax=Erwinia piriflorinigrans CFBP 5888 TaxID=1161919 RepID=V5Z5L5_9GAMM|nr:PrgH/EprH family type III secretion apparatus protein [Erwinia piriflorinigrans]CCG86222.1 Type III secretion system protein PrgH/EprH [Erwinia piriflorinigrans CFBP 5888]